MPDGKRTKVAPLVGAWIETLNHETQEMCYSVAPLVGAWIETPKGDIGHMSDLSHPSWVRGLKRGFRINDVRHFVVAPLVGAWIETPMW